jgi:hypothetical protein
VVRILDDRAGLLIGIFGSILLALSMDSINLEDWVLVPLRAMIPRFSGRYLWRRYAAHAKGFVRQDHARHRFRSEPGHPPGVCAVPPLAPVVILIVNVLVFFIGVWVATIAIARRLESRRLAILYVLVTMVGIAALVIISAVQQ